MILSRPARLAALFLSSAILPARAQVPGTVERFSFRSNADTWLLFDYEDETVYSLDWDLAGDGQNPDVWSFFGGNAPMDIYAPFDGSGVGVDGSGGAFGGDYAATGVDAIGCFVFVEDLASFDFGEFYFYSTADAKYHFSDSFTPDEAGWTFLYTTLRNDPWYAYDSTLDRVVLTPLTDQILSAVTEIGFTFYPLNANAVNKNVGLDDFTLFAKLEGPPLTFSATGGTAQLSFPRVPGLSYTIQSSTDFQLWPDVPNNIGLNGTTPWTFTAPVSGTSKFYRVEVEDFLTPVPEQ